MFGEEDLIKAHRQRAGTLSGLVLFAFAVVLSGLWYLQIYKGNTLYEYSLRNRLRKEIIRAPRGMFFSRNGALLVNNIPRFDAKLTPQYLRKRKETIRRVSKILNIPVAEINKTIKKNRGQASYRPILIKKNISRKEVAQIETENFDLPGISVETFISREYRDKEIGAHLYGYISEINSKQLKRHQENDDFAFNQGDYVGQAGLEIEWDSALRGENGVAFVEVDALGRKKSRINTDNFFKGIQNKPSSPGENLRLTIDRDMQKSAFEALAEKNGSVVALEVDTGKVLTMVSRPSYNPTNFNRGLNEYFRSLVMNPSRPFRNRAIQDHYAPGSTFKTMTLIAALEEGVVDENTEVKCSGRFKLGRRTYHCWKRYGHGKVNAVKSLRESCDVYFYKIATKLDIDVLAKYAKALGLGSKTGVQLPGEVSGLIPTKDWKIKHNGIEWQLGETLSCVIGQSYVLSTPIQLAMSYAAIANGGTLFSPFVVEKITNNQGDVLKEFSPVEKSRINISEKTLNIVKRGLYEVANSPKGTVWWRRGKGLQMAGKTGTSQVIRMSAEKLYAKCDEKEYQNRHHALFVGYAPADAPKVVAAAVIEHGCSGSKAAAPVVVSVLETYMKKYHPKIYENNIKTEKIQFSRFIKKRQKAREEQEKKKEAEAALEASEG